MASDRVDMSVGKGSVNGDYITNGVVPLSHQKGSGLNGDVKVAKGSQSRQDAENPSSDISRPHANGVDTMSQQAGSWETDHAKSIEQLPPELLEMMAQIPLESFIPMSQLISRSAQTCWADLHRLVERLAIIHLNPLRPDQDRFSNGNVNDTSLQNREKKLLIWEFAKRHKDVLVKLLVLLQSGKKMEEVRKTIALNFFLHQRRSAFNNATISLGNMVRDLSAAQIPNPDLATAAEVLATGKVSSFPHLEYLPPQPLTSKKMLSILRRLNVVLCTRMTLQDEVPPQMSQWHVHDGRVTFTIPHEFELDLSLVDENPTANFGMVDLRFLFSPAPSLPNAMRAELEYLTNSEMEKEGLVGAYNFLHELTLSYKLKELHRQALAIAQGQWAGNLRVEMHRRTLVVQYWTQRTLNKSWIEIGVSSGRVVDSASGASSIQPFLSLQWTREGKRIDQHDIQLDVDDLSIEDVLRHAIAQQINHSFDTIYDRLMMVPLYESSDLELEQTPSLTDPHSCSIGIQATKNDVIKVSVEPIGGSFVLTSVSERASRLQYDLSKSRNFIDEFPTRILGLRCSIAESRLLRCIMHTRWESLPGLRLSATETRDLFGLNVVRATFFRHETWNSSWLLAATFGSDGDRWWLVYQLNNDSSSRIVQPLDTTRLHLEETLSRTYFERLATFAATIISLQCNAQDFRLRNIRSILESYPEFSQTEKIPALAVELKGNARFSALKSRVSLKPRFSQHDSNVLTLVVIARFSAPPDVLQRLASTDLDPSITIIPDTRRLTIVFEKKVGDSIVEDLMLKLRRIDDVVSCVTLVQRSKTWELQSCSMSNMNLIYDKNASENLSLAISLASGDKAVSATLLPEESNPHKLVSPHVSKILQQGNEPLAVKLARLLAILHMSLPMVRCLRQLQDNGAAFNSKDNSESDKNNSKDWLRIHIMARDMTRFGVHFFSAKTNFKPEITDNETPKKMLARFEIEPQPGKDGALLTWILRPAVEEYRTYVRPSFAAQNLSERLKKEVFANVKAKDWLSLDTAAKCKIDNPLPVLTAVHRTVLDWLKEASAKKNSDNVTTTSNIKQQTNNNALTGSKQTKTGGQANNTKTNTGPGVQSSRVMTAAPQQIRNTPNKQQRQQQANSQQQKNDKAALKREQEVITLD